MKFKSAIDPWLIIVGLVFPAIAFAVALAVAAPMPASSWAIIALLAIVTLGLPIWLFMSTIYEVNNGELVIRSGPFKWHIPLAEISSVEPSRSWLSSPALSLDRLKIRYRKHRMVLVSPKDQAGFIRALDLPHESD